MSDSNTPVGAQPSEAQSMPVEARQPEEQNPPQVTAAAASSLEGAVGTKNRAHFGTDPDDVVNPDGDTRSGQNPPQDRSQRPEEGGSFPPAEKNQAALKSATLHTDGLAGRVEAAVEDETPGQHPAEPGHLYTGPNVGADGPGTVPDALAKTTGQVVSDALDSSQDAQ